MLRAHLAPGDPLAGYADRLEDPELRGSVRGYLTGSIDLVLRVGEAFAIADYKTNWLAAPGEALTAWHHRPERFGPFPCAQVRCVYCSGRWCQAVSVSPGPASQFVL